MEADDLRSMYRGTAKVIELDESSKSHEGG
jgi:hypothetical protein